MKTCLDCIPCFTQQALDVVKRATEDSRLQLRIMRRVLEAAGRFPEDAPPPAMGAVIHRLIRQETGNPDPYREIKRRANEFALEMMPDIRRLVERSEDRFGTVLRLAIAGNIMDWGAKPHTDISEQAVKLALSDALRSPLDGEAIESLRGQLACARRVLYLADNAGEIAFDRLLLERLPAGKVTVAVRGYPIINDATLADAEQVGLTELAPVVANGSDAPGTILEECSDEFRGLFSAADLIIAKGQGNYETLSERPENIFFLFKVKCPVVAQHSRRAVGEMAVLRARRPGGGCAGARPTRPPGHGGRAAPC